MKNIQLAFIRKMKFRLIAFASFLISFFSTSTYANTENRKALSVYLRPVTIQNKDNDDIINISKAKNSVLPLLMASLMHNGITNLYIGDSIELLDTESVIDILVHLKAKVVYSNGVISIDTREVKPIPIDQKLSSRTRYSILALGSLYHVLVFLKLVYLEDVILNDLLIFTSAF